MPVKAAAKAVFDYFAGNTALKKDREAARKKFKSIPDLIAVQHERHREVVAAKALIDAGEKTAAYLVPIEHAFLAAARAIFAARLCENYLIDTAPEELRVARQRAKRKLVATTEKISQKRFDISQAEEAVRRVEESLDLNLKNHYDPDFQRDVGHTLRDKQRIVKDLKMDLDELTESVLSLEQDLDQAHTACIEA